MNFIDIEKAGFQSLPVEQQLEINDGVVIRTDIGQNRQGQDHSGYTKRANSATVLLQQNGNFAKLTQRCEQYYQAKGLPCIFRLPSFAQNQRLDDYLADNGYQFVDHSLVLYQSIEAIEFNSDNLIMKQPLEWMKSYCTINNTNFNQLQHLLGRLNRIKDKTLFAVLVENDKELACAISVISNQYCGIFNLVTEQASRNKGFGTRLLNGMLNWARTNEATKTYIQVVADNTPAINLYKKLGFKFAYEYHYRVKPKS